MQITVKRSGGFAGLSEEVVWADTSAMDPKRAQEVEQLVRGMGFFSLAPRVAGESIGADMLQYEITITDGVRRHTVAFVDEDRPETAPHRRLVEMLRQ